MRYPKHEVCSEPEDTVFRDQKEAASFLRCLGPFWQGKHMAIYPDQTCSNIDCGRIRCDGHQFDPRNTDCAGCIE